MAIAKFGTSLKARVASSVGVGAMALALVVGGANGAADQEPAAQASAEATVAAPEMDLVHYSYTYSSKTSPAFAENVARRFHSSMHAQRNDAGYVYSPTTGQSYWMSCYVGASSYICTGGNGAAVYFHY